MRTEFSKEKKVSATGRACAACGQVGNRLTARYCSACGQDLNSDFSPARSLMASYYQQRTRALAVVGRVEPALGTIAREDGLTAFAFAFVTFSVVPFLGIMFCPIALLFSVCCFARRTTHARTELTKPAVAIALTLVISVAQIGLWWMLVQVPGATPRF